MTAFAIRSTTNHHGSGTLSRVLRTLTTWHDRSVQRAELSRLTELELHDVGLSYSAIAGEIAKPFWRA